LELFFGIFESYHIDISLSCIIFIANRERVKATQDASKYLVIVFVSLFSLFVMSLYLFMGYTVSRLTKACEKYPLLEISDMKDEKFGFLLDDKRKFGTKFQRHFNLVQLLKDVLFSVLLFSLYYRPMVLIVILTTIQALFLIGVCCYPPFKKNWQTYSLRGIQGLYLFLDIMLMATAITEKTSNESFRYFVIGFSLIGIVFLIILNNLAFTTYGMIKDYREKKRLAKIEAETKAKEAEIKKLEEEIKKDIEEEKRLEEEEKREIELLEQEEKAKLDLTENPINEGPEPLNVDAEKAIGGTLLPGVNLIALEGDKKPLTGSKRVVTTNKVFPQKKLTGKPSIRKSILGKVEPQRAIPNVVPTPDLASTNMKASAPKDAPKLPASKLPSSKHLLVPKGKANVPQSISPVSPMTIKSLNQLNESGTDLLKGESVEYPSSPTKPISTRSISPQKPSIVKKKGLMPQSQSTIILDNTGNGVTLPVPMKPK
jgi:hypothetical protein